MTSRRSMLARQMKACLARHPDTSPEEIAAHRQRVADGNDPNSNPRMIACEQGWEMDFIDGIRAERDMWEAISANPHIDLT